MASVRWNGKLPRATLLSLAACVFYGSMSFSMSMVNKAVVSSWQFSGFFTLLTVQSMVTIAVAVASMSRTFGNPFRITPLTPELMIAAVPMAVTSLCSVLLGLLGMKLVDVPMFFTLRRLVTPTIILYEYTALGKIPQRDVLLAIGVSTLGTMIAAAPTLSADMLAYLVVIATNFFTAANMAFQKKYRDETSASVLTTVLINSLLTLPVTGTLALLTGEVTNLVHFEYVTHAGFWLSFVAAATMGLILTFAAMLNTTYNSPIATSVTGNVKDIATSLVGWVLFPGFKSSVPAVAGILLSFLGAFMYSYANLVRSLAVASGSKDTAGQVLHVEATAHKLNSSAVAAALDSSRLTTSPAGHASSTVPLQMPRFEKMHAHSKLV